MIGEPRRYLALDIGGTLAKLCFLRSLDHDPELELAPSLSNLRIELENRQVIQFQFFKSGNIDECIDYINKYLNNYQEIAITGGGSYKFLDLFQKLGKTITQVDEFNSLLNGIQCIRGLHVQHELFSVKSKKVYEHPVNQDTFYPFLMVNVGSGVSILTVSRQNEEIKTTRVGGTCLGGGFFLGLSEMIIGSHNFSQLLEMAQQGDNTKVDIVPGDFQQLEKSYPNLGDAPVLISMGKLSQQTTSKQDIAKGLFLMVAYNLAQISLMHSNVCKIDRIVFTGFFCRNNTFMIDCFEQAFSFFQKEQQSSNIKHAYGLKHDGYLGALGSLYTLIKRK